MAAKYFIASLLFIIVSVINAKECGQCQRSECPQLIVCTAGVSQDACRCCEICAQNLGEKCDMNNATEQIHGKCGEYLQCDQVEADVGICVCTEEGAVCGSDEQTYISICELLVATAEDSELTLLERTPCRAGPKIKSSPKDALRPRGSILVLDCEATGFPVPIISWELYKTDGSAIQLPNDDSLVAVQVRGGPEKHMVTGWVQIMKILPENVGIYTCIATNSKGIVKASAKVSFKQENVVENEL